MIWISPLLALIALVTVPLSVVVTLLIARRSQKQFAAQWKWTGSLNGHVEEMHTGHALMQVFGRRASAQKVFEEHNGRLFEASFKAQFLSGIIQPAIQFLANLNYVAVAVIGAYRVASGTMTLGDVQAFIQYSRQFTMPIMQIAGQMNLLQSGLASAERVFELLDAEEETSDVDTGAQPDAVSGQVALESVNFRYEADKPLIADFNLQVRPGQTIARAFLADPTILILDEATSNVDTRTEVLIQKAMAQLRQGRTSFVIAHRLSTIRNADAIVVMDSGKIVEQGSHAELLQRKGFYFRLYNSQFAESWSGNGEGPEPSQRTLETVSKRTSSA